MRTTLAILVAILPPSVLVFACNGGSPEDESVSGASEALAAREAGAMVVDASAPDADAGTMDTGRDSEAGRDTGPDVGRDTGRDVETDTGDNQGYGCLSPDTLVAQTVTCSYHLTAAQETGISFSGTDAGTCTVTCACAYTSGVQPACQAAYTASGQPSGCSPRVIEDVTYQFETSSFDECLKVASPKCVTNACPALPYGGNTQTLFCCEGS